MSTFAEQGKGANAKPHLLVARINGWGGVSWRALCPHDGPRDCGMLEKCYSSPKEQEKYGCPPRPVPPSDLFPLLEGVLGPEKDKEISDAWETFHDAMDQWRTHHEIEHHRTEDCWFEKALEEGWVDSEEYLSLVPEGTEVVSPLKVLVGHDGYDEDIVPKFKLWEEPTNDHS